MPDPRYVATVKANGQNYTAFETITVSRSVTDGISYFQMTCSEGGPLGGSNDARRLVPGTPVQILLGGKLVLTGAVTTRTATYDGQSHTLLVGGRSLTADGLLSAVAVQPGNFDGYSGEQAARGVLQPHGTNLKVVNPPPLWSKPFPYLAVNPGEHGGEFLERICKMRGAFIWDDEQGNVCVGQGNPSAAVVAAAGRPQHPARPHQTRRPKHLQRRQLPRRAARHRRWLLDPQCAGHRPEPRSGKHSYRR